MDSVEISEWRAWDRITPLPDLNWLAGQICATVANAMVGGKHKPEDFIPRWSVQQSSKTKEQATKEAFAKLAALSEQGKVRVVKPPVPNTKTK